MAATCWAVGSACIVSSIRPGLIGPEVVLFPATQPGFLYPRGCRLLQCDAAHPIDAAIGRESPALECASGPRVFRLQQAMTKGAKRGIESALFRSHFSESHERALMRCSKIQSDA